MLYPNLADVAQDEVEERVKNINFIDKNTKLEIILLTANLTLTYCFKVEEIFLMKPTFHLILRQIALNIINFALREIRSWEMQYHQNA